MLELALLRHAKSDWENPGTSDFDRPLNSRGIQAAARMGKHLRERGFFPDRILCSPARRACETLEHLGRRFNEMSQIDCPEDLYLAAPETLFSRIGEMGGVGSLLVIAHNPGLEDFARGLAGRVAGSSRAQTTLAAGFVTAALAIFEIDTESFSMIRDQDARLVHMVTPRGLD